MNKGKKPKKQEVVNEEDNEQIEIEKVTEISEEEIEEIDKEAEGIKARKLKLEEFNKEGWSPKTRLGKAIKTEEITNIDNILDNGLKILEPEIVDVLIPDLQTELLLIGQAKGKFGGGQRRVFRQTQKKTKDGNKPKFSTVAVVGNNNGYIGIGFGKSKDTVPAREKAFRKAKLDIFKIRRGCGSWECTCDEPHSIPFKVSGKCTGVQITLMPAPKGTGLKIEKECAKILKMAGISDIWSKSNGMTKTKINLIKACITALKELNKQMIKPKHIKELKIVEGRIDGRKQE